MTLHTQSPGDGDASVELPPDPLEVLRRWPDACRADLDCEISGTRYPAPNGLDGEDLRWWIDVTEMRVNASRNLLNGSVSAVLGGLVGAAVGTASGWASGSAWIAATAGGLSVVAVVLVGRFLLGDSDHLALEQRLLLYRRRGRTLSHQARVSAADDEHTPRTVSVEL